MSNILATNLMLTGLLLLFSTTPLVSGWREVRFIIFEFLSSIFQYHCCLVFLPNWRSSPHPVSSEMSVLCEISDLLLFVSYFASQRKRNKVWQLLFWCVLCKLKAFGKTSDTYNKIEHRIKYKHWKILALVLDLNYFSFSNPSLNPKPTHFPKH